MELEIYLKKIAPSSKIGFVGAVLIFFYFVDFLGKIGSAHDLFLVHLPSIIKPIFFLALFYYLGKNINQFDKKYVYGCALLVVIFVIGQLSLNVENKWMHLLKNVKILSWYLLPFSIYLFIKTYLKPQQLQHLLAAFEWIFIFNTSWLIIGLLYNIPEMKSYGSHRFGYIGLFRNISQGSYIYMIYALYFFFKYNKTKDRRDFVFWIISILACLLTGSKLLIILSVILMLYGTISNKKIIIPIFTLISVLLYYLINSNWFIENILKIYAKSLFKVYREKGFISMLFSLRDQLFTENFLPYIENQWTAINFVFGGGSFQSFRTQLEYVDLFWFFGVIGTIIFLLMWYKIIGKQVMLHPLFLLLWLLIGLAGNFFSSLTVCTHFIIFILYLKSSLDINFNQI